MLRLRRSSVVSRSRREQQRNQMRARWQVNNQTAGDTLNPSIIATVNDLAQLHLQHQVANTPIMQDAQQPNLPRDNAVVHQTAIQLPQQHGLGDLNNRCPHYAARYFQKECTAQHVFTRCCF